MKPFTFMKINYLMLISLIMIFYTSLIISIIKVVGSSPLYIFIIYSIGSAAIIAIGSIYQRRFPNLLKQLKPDLISLFRFAFKPWASVYLLVENIKIQQRRVNLMRQILYQNVEESETAQQKQLKATLLQVRKENLIQIKNFTFQSEIDNEEWGNDIQYLEIEKVKEKQNNLDILKIENGQSMEITNTFNSQSLHSNMQIIKLPNKQETAKKYIKVSHQSPTNQIQVIQNLRVERQKQISQQDFMNQDIQEHQEKLNQSLNNEKDSFIESQDGEI